MSYRGNKKGVYGVHPQPRRPSGLGHSRKPKHPQASQRDLRSMQATFEDYKESERSQATDLQQQAHRKEDAEKTQ